MANDEHFQWKPSAPPIRTDSLPGFDVRWALHPSKHVVDFAIFAQVAYPPQKMYQSVGGENPGDWTDDIDKAEPFAEGEVKWDGCMDWALSSDVMAHHCERAGLDEFCAALRHARRIAMTEIMPQDLVKLGGNEDEYRDEPPRAGADA